MREIQTSQLTGTVVFKVKRILMRDSETRYTKLVGFLLSSTFEGRKPREIRVRGVFPVVYEGDECEACVSLKADKRTGEPYYALSEVPTVRVPEKAEALAGFIAKRVRGLSKKKALEIIDSLGMQALTHIQSSHECLLKIGIPEKKAIRIREQLVSHHSFELLAVFVQSMQLGTRVAEVAYEQYQDAAIARLKQNPYDICKTGRVSFKQADIMAKALQFSPMNRDRIVGGIFAYLRWRSQSYGDICVPEAWLFQELNRLLTIHGAFGACELEEDVVRETLDILIERQALVVEVSQGQRYLYLKSFYQIEQRIIENIQSLLYHGAEPFCSQIEVRDFIQAYEARAFPLDTHQQEAIFSAIQHRISILTGGPGTGKTMTTNAIVECIQSVRADAKLLLLAPTGKAADRLTELTGLPASTIHRGIGLNPLLNESAVKSLDYDYIFVDESSMIDAQVFERLTSIIGAETRIVFIGDVDQLPSVGAGLILRDLIESNRIPTVRLTKIFRQSETSAIVKNAHSIIRGAKTTDSDGIDVSHPQSFCFLEATQADEVRALVERSLDKLLQTYRYQLADICILAPVRQHNLGVVDLNELLQEKLNPPCASKREWKNEQEMVFREGDRVMQTLNDYDLDVFNGFIGEITSISEVVHQGKLTTEIEVVYSKRDEPVIYNEQSAQALDLAFAMTIHKSQGSEFPVVIMPIHSTHEQMLSRNLIYTGVTRAKERLIMIGQEETLNEAIGKEHGVQRISRIREKIASI